MFPRLRNDAPARCIDVIRLIDVRDEERGLLFLREAISISHGENKEGNHSGNVACFSPNDNSV